jgi:GH25 family lysozyme M1 (1,4-beta-N-acetylmuramidase)
LSAEIVAWSKKPILVAVLLSSRVVPAQSALAPGEVILTDDPTRSDYGRFDLNNFGPPTQRKVGAEFQFPKDVDVPLGYGIDISHHTKEVPWAALVSAKVNYVYMKASQSHNGRDDKFVEFWNAANTSALPHGAYHFLTAGIPGRDQALYFNKRLTEVGGIKSGNLQPVIDLEWDEYGPYFKRMLLGHTSSGDPIYKDYWEDVPKDAITATVNEFVNTIRYSVGSQGIKPIIYTNRSWWDSYIPPGTVFQNCSVWISDYRKSSYVNGSPRSVKQHEYYLWQFTDKATISVSGEAHGPYDTSKLLFGGINHITIA